MNTNTPSLSDLLNQFLESITDPDPANRPNSIEDPRFESILNSQSLILQSKLAERFDSLSNQKPENETFPNRVLRTLALMEKTRTRIDKSKPKAPSLDATPERQEAHTYLQNELAQGPRSANDLITQAMKLGIAKRTLIRAKSDLNVASHLTLEGARQCWMWSFPKQECQPQQ